MKNIFIVVPTLNPEEEIMDAFITELKKEFQNILVINDGSDAKFIPFFKKLEKEGIEVFTHYKNLGKGRALKNAFNYLLATYPEMEGVITCDCDGQHSVKDIKRCAKALLKSPNKVILGTRDFDQDNVPFKSRYGNKITRNVITNLVGISITDTQTGLRGLGRDLMIDFMDLDGERYDYETTMLIACKERNIETEEVIIETIYINSNEGSHFHPIKDSMKIYRLFMKNFMILFSSFVFDMLFFGMFYHFMNHQLLLSVGLARLLSSVYYACMNRKLFKYTSKSFLGRYVGLTILELGCSMVLIHFFSRSSFGGIVLAKMIIDFLLWLVFFFVRGKVLFYEK